LSARVGIGYDSHRFAPGRRLVLGGVEIEHEQGLEGHSDADVVAHATIDATVICEAPPLGPHRAEMERNLTEAVGAPVSVKATSNEGMGFTGRGEGIACIAVALIHPQSD